VPTLSDATTVHVSALHLIQPSRAADGAWLAVGYGFGCFRLYSLQTLAVVQASEYEGALVSSTFMSVC
jgi:hypothetical protein